jgi:hypothetical protein
MLRGLEQDSLWHVEGYPCVLTAEDRITDRFLVKATILRSQMYRDMHLGVYNLTRRLGEVVGDAQPWSAAQASIGAAPLFTNICLRTGSYK